MAGKSKRIKLIWGSSKVIQGRWHFGLWGRYERVAGRPGSGLAVSLRGVLILVLSLGLAAYMGGASAIYLWLSRNSYSYVTYADIVLLPVRWHEVRQKRGQAYIDQGMADLKKQRWGQGLMRLRLGVEWNPRALPARLTLAQFYVMARDRKQALQVLADGVRATPGFPGQRYLSSYFGIAMGGNDYRQVLTACDRYLGKDAPALSEEDRYWVLEQKINVLLSAEQWTAAGNALQSAPRDDVFNEKRVLVLLGQRQTKEAGAFLAQWHAQEGATPQILRLQARVCRDARDTKGLELYLGQLRQLQPASPAVYVYGVIQRQMAGMTAGADAALSDYFFRFSGYEANLRMLAAPLQEIGAVDLLQRCLRQVGQLGYDRLPFLLALAQAQLDLGQWDAAADTVAVMQTMTADGRDPEVMVKVQLVATLAQLAAAPTPGLENALLQALQRRLYPLKFYQNTASILMHAGRYSTALQVISQAEQMYTLDDALLADKTAAARALASAQQKITVATTLPDAGKDDQALALERVFFKRVDAAMAAQQWEEALTMIRTVQRMQPDWLAANSQQVLTRQMRAAKEAQETLTMTLAAHRLLDGSVSRARLVTDYARQLHEAGDRDDAILLVREVIRVTPEDAFSQRLLAEWTGSAQKRGAASSAPAN